MACFQLLFYYRLLSVITVRNFKEMGEIEKKAMRLAFVVCISERLHFLHKSSPFHSDQAELNMLTVSVLIL